MGSVMEFIDSHWGMTKLHELFRLDITRMGQRFSLSNPGRILAV